LISKDEYLLRNFSKITHKKWELFVITRILHNLNDPDIEYICQQYINPKNSENYYLADICFPSLKLYYEIDEGQHAKSNHQEDDKIRQKEILQATDWEEKRIRVYDKSDPSKGRDLREVIVEVDKFISFLKKRKIEIEKKNNCKITWNFKDRYNPEIHIKKGFISASDNVVFLNHRDALRLFGYQGGHYQRAWWHIKKTNKAVWFPKLYPNKDWRNSITADGSIITQEMIVDDKPTKNSLPTTDHKRIVFAHYKNVLGQTVYKFYGEYIVDWEKTNDFTQIFKRISKKISLSSKLLSNF